MNNGKIPVSFGKLEHLNVSERSFRQALEKALFPLGGMGEYVKSGSRVFLNIDQSVPMDSLKGATTSPRLVAVVADLCRKAGAAEIWAGGFASLGLSSREVMKATGMEKTLREMGIRPARLDEMPLKSADIGEGMEARRIPVPSILDEVDCIINMPVIKTTPLDILNGACMNMGNLIPPGVRLGFQGQGSFFKNLGYFIKKYPARIAIIDASVIGEGQGPWAGTPFWWGYVMVSADPALADVVAADLLGLEWKNMELPRGVAGLGAGFSEPRMADLMHTPFEGIRKHIEPADQEFDRYPCRMIIGEKIVKQGTLFNWKITADKWLKEGIWNMLSSRGIPTFMFGDADDAEFEKHKAEGLYFVLDDSAKPKYKNDPQVIFIPGHPVPETYIRNDLLEIVEGRLKGKKSQSFISVFE